MTYRKAKKEYGKVIIVRHGETPLNANDEIRGMIDVPLDEKGIERAHDTGKELSRIGVYGLLVSDLKRTRQTAEIISKEAGIPILEVTECLYPWNLGKFTGKPVTEVIKEIQDYAMNKPLTKIPEGESFHNFINRFLDYADGLPIRYMDKTVALVTHHRNERAMAAWYKAGCLPNHALDLHVMFQEGIDPGDWRWSDEKIETPKKDS